MSLMVCIVSIMAVTQRSNDVNNLEARHHLSVGQMALARQAPSPITNVLYLMPRLEPATRTRALMGSL